MTQEELRELYNERVQREKQCYISKQTNINSGLVESLKQLE